MPNTELNERIRRIAVEEFHRARPELMTTLTAHIDERFASLRNSIAELSQQQSNTDDGQIHMIGQIKNLTESGERQEDKIDKIDAKMDTRDSKMDGLRDLLTAALTKFSRREGEEEERSRTKERDSNILKTFLGIVGSSGIIAAVRWLMTHFGDKR